MSTKGQENQIELLLGSLLNEASNEINATDLAIDIKIKKIGKIESLRKTHVSMMISFSQMLDYINKIREPVIQEDIKVLLQSYVEMALRYYTQYEYSLLEEIENQYKVQKESRRAIEVIKALQDLELSIAIPHLEKICSDAATEYEKLLEKFPALLQSAIDRLRDEWQRLGSIAVASQTLIDDKNLIQLLKAIVDVAAHSIGIEAERIVVVPGKEFALYFFKYLDNFAVLTVPIYSVTAPWEWSIFWHELAGYKVRRLEKDTTLNTIRQSLDGLRNRYKASNEEDRRKLLDSVTRDIQFRRKYLEEKIFGDELDLIDLVSFEHQFERMLTYLPKKNRLQLYQRIKNQGWSVDWFKELFEDAWSVLAIGQQFLPFFEDVLRRHDAKDDRHPPLEIRLQVAKEILNLTSPDTFTDADFKSKMPEKAAAEQILNFIAILYSAARKPEIYSDDQVALKKVHSAANKLDLYGYDLSSLQKVRDFLFDSIREVIQEAIQDWSLKYPEADSPVGRAKADAEQLIQSFSDTVADIFSLSFDYDKEEKNQIKSSYEEMLKGKKYKELQVLSFFEQDFFNSSQIKNIIFGKNISFKKNQRFKSITQSVVLEPVAAKGPGGDDDITYTVDNIAYHTSLRNWNDTFPANSPYFIC